MYHLIPMSINYQRSAKYKGTRTCKILPLYYIKKLITIKIIVMNLKVQAFCLVPVSHIEIVTISSMIC